MHSEDRRDDDRPGALYRYSRHVAFCITCKMFAECTFSWGVVVFDYKGKRVLHLQKFRKTYVQLESRSFWLWGKRVLHSAKKFIRHMSCGWVVLLLYTVHGCVVATCKMTAVLVLMSHSLTIDHRSCSNKDTKEKKQYVHTICTTYIPVVTHIDRGPLGHSTGTLLLWAHLS